MMEMTGVILMRRTLMRKNSLQSSRLSRLIMRKPPVILMLG